MTGRQLGGFALGVCLFLIAPQLALAQTTVSLSYDPLLHELTEDSVVGGHASIAKSFGAVAAVGEVGANHFDQATVLTVAPGFRYGIRTGGHSRISPSVQAVVGLWHCGACEVNELFVQPGVLLDVGRSSSMKVRVQFDVRRIFFDFGGETAERVSVGGVWMLR